MIRVSVLDDSPVYVHGLRLVISAAPDMRVVDVDPSGGRPWRTDVFLVGVEVLVDGDADVVREVTGNAPVLMLDEGRGGRRPVEGFGLACVGGVLDRSVSPRGMVDAIRSVATGREVVSEVDDSAEPVVATPELLLSNRERQVLEQIAHGRTHGEIAAAMRISRHTVETYVKRIRQKLGLGNKAELTRVAVLCRDLGNRPDGSFGKALVRHP